MVIEVSEVYFAGRNGKLWGLQVFKHSLLHDHGELLPIIIVPQYTEFTHTDVYLHRPQIGSPISVYGEKNLGKRIDQKRIFGN